jgi:hypothetical protein
MLSIITYINVTSFYSIGNIYICNIQFRNLFARQLGPVNHGKKSIVDNIDPSIKLRYTKSN